MFKLSFETDSLFVVIQDKDAGEDLSLTDAIALVEQGLLGLGYAWDGVLDIVDEEEESTNDKSFKN